MRCPLEGVLLRSLDLHRWCVVESKNASVLENGVDQLTAKKSYPGEIHIPRRVDPASTGTCRIDNAELAGRFAGKPLPSS